MIKNKHFNPKLPEMQAVGDKDWKILPNPRWPKAHFV